MHSMKIKEVLTGSPSCRDSGGGIRAVKLTLCAALLAAAAGAQPAADWTITTFAGNGEYGEFHLRHLLLSQLIVLL